MVGVEFQEPQRSILSSFISHKYGLKAQHLSTHKLHRDEDRGGEHLSIRASLGAKRQDPQCTTFQIISSACSHAVGGTGASDD